MKYKVEFEIFGKVMRGEIEANGEEDAKYLTLGRVMRKVKFRKIVPVDDQVDFLMGIFGIKK